jgi:hypothetical protein
MAMEEGDFTMRRTSRRWIALAWSAALILGMVTVAARPAAAASVPGDPSPAPVVPEAPKGANYLLPISAFVILAGGGALVATRSRRRAGRDDPESRPNEPTATVSSTASLDEPSGAGLTGGGPEHE